MHMLDVMLLIVQRGWACCQQGSWEADGHACTVPANGPNLTIQLLGSLSKTTFRALSLPMHLKPCSVR